MNERISLIKGKIEGALLMSSALFFISSIGYEYYLRTRQIPDYVILTYTSLFLLLSSLHSINAKFICNRLKQNLGLIANYPGKAMVFIITGVMYYPTQCFYNKIANYVLIGLGLYCLFIECLLLNKPSSSTPHVPMQEQVNTISSHSFDEPTKGQ